MSDRQRRIAQYEVWAAKLDALRRHQIPILQTCQAELAHGTEQLQSARKVTATIIYVRNGLASLAGLHATALSALSRDEAFGARTLAQQAIPLAVSLLYVLDDPTGDRLTGAMRHHVDMQEARIAEWQAAAPGNASAAQQAAVVAAVRRQSPWYADAPAWPSLAARAEASGVSELVHPTLAPSANADQLAAHELIGILECEQTSEAERGAALTYHTARLAADALSVETAALHLFAEASYRLASVFQDKVALTIAESALDKTTSLLAEQHQLDEAHRNDTHLYFGLRSR